MDKPVDGTVDNSFLHAPEIHSSAVIHKDHKGALGGDALNQDVMVHAGGVSMQRWLGGAAGLAEAGSAGMAVAGLQLALPLG